MTEPSDEAEGRALVTALTGFSARAGHDMGGPLSQASSLLALFIKRYRDRIEADTDQLLDYLQIASERMEETARGVRRFMEIAEKRPVRVPVDLSEVLASALKRLRREIEESGTEIVSESLPVVMGDASQLAVVFENLIGNCIKFRREGVPSRVHISAAQEGNMHAVAVRDEGLGVDPERAVLFIAFKRLNGREFPGTGLGLATARLIVERQGGTIGLAPVDGQGACVRFTVPTL